MSDTQENKPSIIIGGSLIIQLDIQTNTAFEAGNDYTIQAIIGPIDGLMQAIKRDGFPEQSRANFMEGILWTMAANHAIGFGHEKLNDLLLKIIENSKMMGPQLDASNPPKYASKH